MITHHHISNMDRANIIIGGVEVPQLLEDFGSLSFTSRISPDGVQFTVAHIQLSQVIQRLEHNRVQSFD